MASKSNEFEQEMARLEAEIKRLEAEYNMFFAGRLPRLPWETRARVDALVKHYDRQRIANTAQKFRFGTLQSRYVSFCELWERTLKAREEGRPIRGARGGGGGAATPPAPPMPAAAASGAERTERAEAQKESRARIVASAAIKDPAKDAERLKELYEQLSSARKKAGEKPLPFDSFAKVVRAQVNKLGGGASGVAFNVAVQGGKVTLTAKKDSD